MHQVKPVRRIEELPGVGLEHILHHPPPVRVVQQGSKDARPHAGNNDGGTVTQLTQFDQDGRAPLTIRQCV